MTSGLVFLDSLRQYRLLEEEPLERFLSGLPQLDTEPRTLADEAVRQALLTRYQADRILAGCGAELSLGQHVILDQLGEGGMGQVLKARHRRLKRIDAIKIIRPECLTNKVAVKRFFLEAEVVARLDHPNIIRVYDAAEEGDRYYFVMEFVPGVDLGKLVAENGSLPPAVACNYIRQAALGLQHAHEKHLVHRDIKPSNLLLLTQEQIVKVLDLGLAQLRTSTIEGGDASQPLTPQGMIMGTPDYMAPEQAEHSSRVDIRADIYALGCTFYQLLTGSVPYPGGTLVEKLARHSYAPVPELLTMRSDLSPELAIIVEKMLAKRPQERYQQPAEVAAALVPFSDVGSVPKTVPRSHTVDSGSPRRPDTPRTMQGQARDFLPSQWANAQGTPGSLTAPLPVNQDTPTVQMGTRPASRKKGPLIVAALILLVAAGVVGIVFWPRPTDPEPPRRVEKPPEPPANPEKDRKKVEPAPFVKPEVKPKDPVVKPPQLPGELKGSNWDGDKCADRPAAVVPEMARAKDSRWKRVDILVEQFDTRCDRAAFSADGRHALTGTSKLLTSFTVANTMKARTFDPFLISPPGLVSGGNTLGTIALTPDGSASLWATITTTDETVNGAVSLTAEYDAIVRDDGRSVTRFYGDTWSPGPGKSKPPTRCLVSSADGKILVAASNFLRRWDLTLRPHVYDRRSAVSNQLEDEALCLACSRDSKLAVVGCKNRVLYLFPLDRDSETPLAEFKEHSALPRCVVFAGNGWIVSGDNSGQVCIWKVPARPLSEVIKPETTTAAHTQAVLCVASNKDELYATGGADGLVRVGRVNSKELVLSESFPDEVRALVFSEDSKQLLVMTSRQLAAIRLSPTPPEGLLK